MINSKGIFITATGTDVGKTYITALILKKLRDSGINAGYYKAALSGAEKINGKLMAGDLKYVCKTAGIENPPEYSVSYCYQTAVSPHLAAKLENNSVSLNIIKMDYEKIKHNYDYIAVEGSGGIICPLNANEVNPIMLTDVITSLNLNAIIVANSGLGTINSTVLTEKYAKQKGVKISGIIMNHYDCKDILHKDNKLMIERLTGIPVICTVCDNADTLDIDVKYLKDLFEQ